MSSIRVAILGEALDHERSLVPKLNQAGFTLRVYENPESALREFSQSPPDIIIALIAESCAPIIDLIRSMNDIFGRVAPAFFVVIQAEGEQLFREFYDAGAQGVFSWPVAPTLLITKIRLFLKTELRTSSDDPRASGAPYGRFTTLREIARGKMGVVYSAIDSATRRRVALKTVNESDSVPLSRLRLAREIQLLRRLQHPRIVSLLDSGSTAEEFYYAMDFVEGPTLRRLQETHGRLRPHYVAAILHQLADALHYVHSQGVIHRDIKPSNVFICHWRGPILGDFGLSRASDDLAMTPTNMLLGTVAYMSPEVLEGSAPTFRSDLFSLGLLALDMLHGTPLFPDTNSFTIMRAIVEGKLPDPASLIPPNITIDPQLLDTIRSLLQKLPEKRPQSAEELKERLKDYASACWAPAIALSPISQGSAMNSARTHSDSPELPDHRLENPEMTECREFQKFSV